MKKVEKEFELINAIIERRRERAIGLANAEAFVLLECRGVRFRTSEVVCLGF